MSRYIDADKVKEYMLSTGFYCDTEADRKYSAELIDELFPTADVVEVVRCRECKYYLGSNERCELTLTRLRFYNEDKVWDEECYCCWGERKDE